MQNLYLNIFLVRKSYPLQFFLWLFLTQRIKLTVVILTCHWAVFVNHKKHLQHLLQVVLHIKLKLLKLNYPRFGVKNSSISSGNGLQFFKIAKIQVITADSSFICNKLSSSALCGSSTNALSNGNALSLSSCSLFKNGNPSTT